MVAQLILGVITGVGRVEYPKDDPLWQRNRWIDTIHRRHHQVPSDQGERGGESLLHGPRSLLLGFRRESRYPSTVMIASRSVRSLGVWGMGWATSAGRGVVSMLSLHQLSSSMATPEGSQSLTCTRPTLQPASRRNPATASWLVRSCARLMTTIAPIMYA